MASLIKPSYGSHSSLAVTALNSLANSATSGWKSVTIDNTSGLAMDYEVFVKLTMDNTAPANDKAAYVYICPAYYDGSNFNYSDGGTKTLPTSGDASYVIASPNDLKLLGVLNYTTQNMVLQGQWNLSSIFGNTIPDGFLIIIVNFTGAAVASSGNVVYIKPIQFTIV